MDRCRSVPPVAVLAVLVLAAAILAALPGPAARAEAARPPADCRTAIIEAAQRHGLAEDVLLAIGQIESGLSPWAINAGGRPHLFDSHAAAVAGTRALLEGGLDSIDVGCMQVNLFWHPNAFASLADAFDPRTNADYAARLLLGLYARTGSWAAAAGQYHAGDAARQARYSCRFQTRLARIRGEPSPPCPVESGPVAAASASASGAVRVIRGRAESAAVSDLRIRVIGARARAARLLRGQRPGSPGIAATAPDAAPRQTVTRSGVRVRVIGGRR